MNTKENDRIHTISQISQKENQENNKYIGGKKWKNQKKKNQNQKN